MLTYLLHERVFKGEEGKQLEFPNTLLVTAKLSPPVIFGVENDYSRLVVHESKAHIIWNANTGRIQSKSEPSLSPDVTVEQPETKFVLFSEQIYRSCYVTTHPMRPLQSTPVKI